MPDHYKLKFGKDTTICRHCGEPVRFLKVSLASCMVPHGMDNKPHPCKGPTVKVFSEAEKLRFQEQRLAGEI